MTAATDAMTSGKTRISIALPILAIACIVNVTACGYPPLAALNDASGGMCANSGDCQIADFPACDTAQKICVQCFGDMDALCTGQTPACKNDRCARCTQHADCSRSNACLSDGSCAADTQVAYVDPMGTDNPDCTKVNPCTKVSKALLTKRPLVKLRGTTDEMVIITDQNVTLLADPGATLTTTLDGTIRQIRGTSTVEIDDLQITGTSGHDNTGLSVSLGNNVTLLLRHVRISGMSGNQGVGILFAGSSLSVSRSEIYNNLGGGISTASTTTAFDITNNFIHHNGSLNSIVGGAALNWTTGGITRFEFNTIVDNQIQNGSGSSGGVSCDKAGFSAPNNIVARNLVGGDPTRTNSNTVGLCTYPTSTISPTVTALKFSSPDNSPYNYHISAGSSAIGQATTASAVTVDFDDDPRPKNAGDQGADQYKP